jgi:poly-gamma-glutamate synthase PgsB/CapB
VPAPLLVCLLVLLALGGAERLARDRALRAIPIRIHVNGTRAKSTVTRLIWSALLEAGVPTIAKTTGTAARLLLPDRSEVSLRRFGPANIREQLALLRHARRVGARAAVVECMALEPTLQYVAEHAMVRATIGVITNVRLDHTEVMGRDLESIAATLANTIPARGVLVTGASRFAALFRQRAADLGTRLVVVGSDVPGPVDDAGVRARWLEEDTALARAVTRELGIEDEVAERGFARVPLDPGTVSRGTTPLRGGEASWLDATAANDPESLAILLEDFGPWQSARGGDSCRPTRILVYHHRSDRAARLESFARHCADFETADRLVISGPRPPWTVRRAVRRARARTQNSMEIVATPELAGWLAAHAGGAALVFCGNTRGLDVPRLLEETASRD